MDISVFKKMSDNDFFTNKLTHIYFNDFVTNESVSKLIDDINEANKTTKTEAGAIIQPKPILIHISSKGGSLTAGMRLFSVFALSKNPIATIVDNYSASAATFLSINSPYRLINNYGYCMVHGYSVVGKFNKKQQQLHNMLEIYDSYFETVVNIYKERTKFEHEELIELLQHDLLLDAKFCLKKGIVDRIIKLHKTTKTVEIKDNLSEILASPNNNIRISCNNLISDIDKILFEDNLSPVIIHPRHSYCTEKKTEDFDDTNERKTNQTIFETLNIIPRILNIKQPTYAIIDGPISIDDLLPMLYCDRIFMFDYASIICNILYFHNKSSLLIDDNIKNTQLVFDIINQILKEKTKMSETMIKNIKSKFRMITSEEAITLGLCHTIVHRDNHK